MTTPVHKSFKEVIDKYIEYIPSEIYFALLKAHYWELNEIIVKYKEKQDELALTKR